MNNQPALVFGASGEQGRAVLEGFVDAGYHPVFAFTSNRETVDDKYLTDALQCVVLEGNIDNPVDVASALRTTKAQAIFLTTTTNMPVVVKAAGGFQAAQDEECETIVQWFQTLQQVYQEDKLPRTVVFSTRDNVQELARQKLRETGKVWIEPLDDGSIVPHFSGKGRGGEEASKTLLSTPDLKLIQLTMPFFYSNFLGFFCPLPNEERTFWELCGSFGSGDAKIDMMAVTDLGPIVVNVLNQVEKYQGKILRLASERISMDEVAKAFSDLFGKDVVYNPLLPKELAELQFHSIPSAPAFAQMCQFLGDSQELKHDLELTATLLKPRKPTNFENWLLLHSDSTAFSRVGLDRDGPDLTKICVFGALSPQGKAVVKGLLNDCRKTYQIRCTTRQDIDGSAEIEEMIALDPKRVSFVQADFDDLASCQKAAKGCDGAFLAADLQESLQSSSLEEEERHVQNIIDACEGCVRHLVFSTMESIDNVNKDLPEKELLEFSARARAAAYARSKNLSVTFVLMPCYSEIFFDMMEVRRDSDGQEKVVMKVPRGQDNAKVMVMSIDELGSAVASIFHSYQVYAGHEIGLMTEFVTAHEVKSMIQDILDVDLSVETENIETNEWIEARDTYMRDLGQVFAGLSHANAVTSRHSIAKTYKLAPNIRSLRRWVEENRENPSFREKLGLR
ncbi:NmrA family protein [Nitzschia inconspicua]|uniref:NmrA family protein n=1 Tax=Nitzschia inconspicua TaxID=303405 RepID=A0A9K3LUT6_9STRA|nr:NmrA family protein [Nitzschia inconspicua]